MGKKYQIIHVSHGFRNFKSLRDGFNVLRPACTLNYQTDYRQTDYRQASKPKLVGYLPVRGNKYPLSRFTTQHASKMDHANSDMPLFRERPLHYVDTSRTSIRGDKLRADQTFHS